MGSRVHFRLTFTSAVGKPGPAPLLGYDRLSASVNALSHCELRALGSSALSRKQMLTDSMRPSVNMVRIS